VSGGAGLVELGHLEGWDLGLPGAASSSVWNGPWKELFSKNSVVC